MCCLHAVEYYLSFSRKEILTHRSTPINLENMILNEKSQSLNESHQTEITINDRGVIDRSKKEWAVFNACRVSVLQDKESSCGWLHKTVRVWNATVGTVAFMLCTFCHNLKILNLERSYRPMDVGGQEASPRTHVQWQSQFRWWSIGKLHVIPKPYFSPVLPYCSSSLLSFHLYLTIIFYWACYWYRRVSSLGVLRWKQKTKWLKEGETRVREMSVRPVP